jgi:hypothetical protein
MKQLEGENKICRLKKSIYGLKQAARSWNMAIRDVLMKLSFKQNKIDKCL